MQRPEAPIVRYPLSGTGFVLGLVAWMAEQSLSTWFGAWWSEVPWAWLTLIAVAFFVGQILADWCNRKSWLRQTWEHHRRFFDIEKITTPHDVSGNNDLIRVIVRLRFTRKLQNSSILVHVFGCIVNGKAKQKETFLISKDINFLENEQIDLELASIPVGMGRQYSSWCQSPGHSKTVIENSQNIAVIEVSSRRRKQQRFLRLDMMNHNGGTFGRFNLTHDDQELFPTVEELRHGAR